jgi:hypothetical protein
VKTPTAVLLCRIHREIASLKAAARNNGIALPKPLTDLLMTKLSSSAHVGAHLHLCRRQERELRALLSRKPLQLRGSPTIGVPREWERNIKPSNSAKKGVSLSSVSKIYDSPERSGFPVTGGMIESRRQRH